MSLEGSPMALEGSLMALEGSPMALEGSPMALEESPMVLEGSNGLERSPIPWEGIKDTFVGVGAAPRDERGPSAV